MTEGVALRLTLRLLSSPHSTTSRSWSSVSTAPELPPQPFYVFDVVLTALHSIQSIATTELKSYQHILGTGLPIGISTIRLPPTPKEKREIQEACSEYTRQVKHCRQCRADAIGLLGKDIQDQFSEY